MRIIEGQCGKCAHFGEQHPERTALIHIRIRGEAPEAYLDHCGHPHHAGLELQVSAHSSCAGFTPLAA